MFQKILMGSLVLAIMGVIGFGIYDASRVPNEPAIPLTVAPTEVAAEATAVPPTVTATLPPTELPSTAETIDATAEIADATTQLTPETTAQPQSADMMGDSWQAMGTISVLEDMGLTLITTTGSYYVELGPPTYWQEQDITLAEGDTIYVDGYYNGEQVHPVTITANDGTQLILRTENGQPAWSGGSGNGNGTGSAAQVQAEDWITLTGTIGNVTSGAVTLNVDDGTVLDLQMGRPDFWQSQGITLSVDDPVEVLGFWSGTQFMAGDIRKTETGETIMLRDPNGRQLWAGPGRNGNSGQGSGGNGNGGNGNQGNGGNGNGGNGNQGNGGNGGNGNQGNSGSGNGNGYRGGRGA